MLKMKKLYQVVLVSGLLPLVLVLAAFIVNLVVATDGISTVASMVIIFSAGVLLINGFFLYLYYNRARKQNNRQAISRSLLLIGLLVFNIVLDLVVYSYNSYASVTTTFQLENKSPDKIKKMFFSNGADKYFIAPMEPGETTSRALDFQSSEPVNYSYEQKGINYKGVLLQNTNAKKGKKIAVKIFRKGRVVVDSRD